MTDRAATIRRECQHAIEQAEKGQFYNAMVTLHRALWAAIQGYSEAQHGRE